EHLSGGRYENAGEHLHGRRLAGPVRADVGDGLALGYGQIDVVYRDMFGEPALDQMSEGSPDPGALVRLAEHLAEPHDVDQCHRARMHELALNRQASCDRHIY